MGGGEIVIIPRATDCFTQIAACHSGFTECPCVPYYLHFGTFTNPLLSSPGAELYLLEDDMFITLDRGLTRRGFVSFLPYIPNRW